MKLSVFYHHLLQAAEQTGLPLESLIERIGAVGITAVETDYGAITDGADDFFRLINRGRLDISAVFNTFSFEKKPDRMFIDEFIYNVAQSGAKKVLAIPGFIPENEKYPEKLIYNMTDGLFFLCSAAAPYGITITIEDFDNKTSPCSTAKGIKRFLDDIPSLGVTFDTGNFMYSGEDELEAFEKLKDRIVHVHCKDRLLNGESTTLPYKTVSGTPMYPSPVGYGVIKMNEIMQKLALINYDGWYTIEHYDAVNQLSYIEKSALWLKGNL